MTGPVTERPIGRIGPQKRPASDSASQNFDMGGATRAIRRQLPLIGTCAFLGMVIAVLMILGSIPRFRAVETVLLDEERSDLLEEVSPIPNAIYSNSAIQSELEIIRSKVLARRVVDRMNLHEDEVFMNPPVSTTQQVIGLIGVVTGQLADLLEPEPTDAPPAPEADEGAQLENTISPEEAARERAAEMLTQSLDVSRVGRSFVINIAYESYTPERARNIARAYGQSYRTFQLDTSRETAANAGQWVEQRLEELEERSLEAAAEVQRFRAENDLVQVRGDLLSEQQLSEMASELIRASADAAQIGARLENLEALQGAPASEALSVVNLRGADANSGSFAQLREEYLNTRRRYVSIVEEYDEDNPQAQQILRTLNSLETVIDEQVDSAVRSVRAEYEIAQSREQSLRDDLEAITDTRGANVATLGRLSQLEAVAQTYQEFYRDYLQRYELTSQQEAFPIASVKIISAAELPRGASSPQKKAMLASGLFLGVVIGCLLGAIREMGARRVRTRREVESWLGLPCAGLLPKGGPGAREGSAKARIDRQTGHRVLQAADHAIRGQTPAILGYAQATGGTDPLAAAASICRVAERDGDLRPLIIDSRNSGRRKPAGTNTRWGIEIAGLDRLDKLDMPQASGQVPNFIVLVMPSLTELGGVDPYSGSCHATVLGLPWGRVRPDLVENALADHDDFRARLVTTVVSGANLKKAGRYMSRGDYEQQVLNA